MLAIRIPAFVVALLVGCSAPPAEHPPGTQPGPPLALANDNRAPAGVLRDGVFEIELEATVTRWRGEPSDLAEGAADPRVVTVLAFREAGREPTIPGPLIRVPQGTEIRVRVRNSLPERLSIGMPAASLRTAQTAALASDTLSVHGLSPGDPDAPPLRVSRGEVNELRYRADTPGTFFYWATPSSRAIRSWTGIDAQLTGALVVDPMGVEPDPEERIFVITMLDQLPDSDEELPSVDYFRRAINGLSWPDTERLEYEIGDVVRWRWINASFESHPMHLHGFHFRLLGRGDWKSETLFPPDETPLVVTEHMLPGTTFRMEWEPSRAGNWIIHCHFRDHIIPTVERSSEALEHDVHNLEQHALEAMAGLAVGVTVNDGGEAVVEPPPAERIRLVALEERGDDGEWIRGFALERDGEAPPSTPIVPGPPLLLTRGKTTEIEVVNRLSDPTTIHWHGMELESVYDGVAGWSRTRSRVAPLIETNGSFAVRMQPPRAGTFIYHTHMDETLQLLQGMVGPLLVLEPGDTYDWALDRVYLIGGQEEGDYPITVNGAREAPPEQFESDRSYRLRFLHITAGAEIVVSLLRDGEPVTWTPLAKDGADLPPALQVPARAMFLTHTGETFDFEWTPERPGSLAISLRYQPFNGSEEVELSRPIAVR